MSRWDGIDEFVAVAETGSFTRAAERLHESSSQVSRQIARLEDRLQARLFYRTTRSVTLTDAGRTFLGRCQRLIEDREESLAAITELEGQPKGLLRLTCAVAYGEQFIVPLVNDFLTRHPQLRVEIELTNRTVDLVHEGIDLAVRLGRLVDSNLVASRIAPRVMYLCASPVYLERYGTPHTLSELAGHECLIGTAEHWPFADSHGAEWTFRPRGRWRCNSGPAVLDAALRGFGLCQLPDYYVVEHLRNGTLVSLLPAHRPPNTAVWAVYPQRRHLSPKVRMMVEHLREGLAARPEYQDRPDMR